MIKQLTNLSTYKFVIDHKIYYVSITNLKNTYAGQPRFEAIITKASNDYYPRYSYKYYFYGHYYTEKDEARFILNYHLNKNRG